MNKITVLKYGIVVIVGSWQFKLVIDFLRNDSIKELLKRISHKE